MCFVCHKTLFHVSPFPLRSILFWKIPGALTKGTYSDYHKFLKISYREDIKIHALFLTLLYMRLQVSILLFDLFFSVSLSKVILTLMITCIVCLVNKRNFVVLLSKNFYILLQIINHNVKIGLTLSSNYLEIKVVLAADFLLCKVLILETYIIFLELFQNTSYFLEILIVSPI